MLVVDYRFGKKKEEVLRVITRREKKLVHVLRGRMSQRITPNRQTYEGLDGGEWPMYRGEVTHQAIRSAQAHVCRIVLGGGGKLERSEDF